MLALEERRAMEVRRDIRLLVLFAALAFVMIAELGYGGVVGKAVSSVMFGLFGATAYLIPPFVFIMVIFIISNLGKRTLPARTASLVVLMIAIGAGCELWGGEAAKAAAYDPAAIYQRCAAAKEGGGLLGGSLAYGLFSLFRNVGSVFILILLILICLLVATQFSPVARYRKAQERRIERGDPSFMEKRRMKAQQARAESQRRRELIRQEKEREREEREKLLEQERLNREERQKEAQKRADAADMLNSVIEPALQEEEEDFGLDEGSTLFRRREKKPSGTRERNAVPARERNTVPVREAEPAPERIRSNTSHGIRFLDKDRDNTAKAEEVRISAKVIEADGAEPAERILRPDPNTVRVESESMFTIDPAERNDYNRNPGRATMTVFTRTTDTGDLSDDLQFPFHKEENERSMRKIYANDNVGSYMNAGTLDIADAGGMSTFNAQQKAEPAAEASAAAAEAAPVKEAVQAAAPVRTTVTAKEKPQQAAPPISEEDLEGIEVHRDRGEDGGKGAGRTVMSGQNRSRENRKYSFPPFSLMEKGQKANTPDIDQELKETAFRLQETLRTFGVNVTISQISQGPSITRYELQPEQGVKVSRIVNLADDIKLSLAAMDIRIEAPIPGKPAIGIEVPNKHPSLVALRDILETQEFRGAKSRLAFGVGKDLAGNTVVTDIAKMPHLLIAGATGSGKSVCINTIIMSILYKASPDEVQLIMIDPKVVELSVYNGIPHLMIPVVTDVRKASAALNWAVAEMERRYKLFAAAGTRDLNGYNAMVKAKGDEAGENEKVLTRLVVIVDELADLMMVAKNEVESSICRLAQLARACGIHLVIATQRPSVDVITGLIKANMPSRIAFAVSSGTDSRTILDMVGAEKLLGKGDMLFYPQSVSKPVRLQGAFVSDSEISQVTDYIKADSQDDTYDTEIQEAVQKMEGQSGSSSADGSASGGPDRDEYFADAGRFIIDKEKASIGNLQRVFKIGFNRAARIMDQLCEAGVVGEEEGTKPRKVLMSKDEFESLLNGSK